MSAIDQAMQTLTAHWYNAMCTGLNLSPGNFQLTQGSNASVNTSNAMWQIFNSIPPTAINNSYQPGQGNLFSQQYGLVLAALVTPADNGFQNCMGDYYSQWLTYLGNNFPTNFNATNLTAVFNKFTILNCPAKASCVNYLLNFYFNNPLTAAITAFSAAATNGYAWAATVDALQTALTQGTSQSFSMNSLTQSSSLSHTWANASASVMWDLFSFGGGASYDNITQSALSAGVNITASFQKFTTFASGPYAQPNPNNPSLNGFVPWYYSSELGLAFKSPNNNTIWNPASAQNWNTFFSATGVMQRMVQGLVVADGITITMTSTASYSSSEQTQIQAAASGGFWPFFSGSAGGGSNTVVTFNDQGQFTSTTTTNLGNPQILGILQIPMSQLF